MAIVIAGTLVWLAVAALTTPPANAKLGMIAHYELCRGGDWMSLDDVSVNSATGDVWLEEGIFTPSLVHATTTGAVIGSYDGSTLPQGFGSGFRPTGFEVAHSATHVYLADAGERYTNATGRMLQLTAARNPSFVRHFKQPPGTIPSDATVMRHPIDIRAATIDGTAYAIGADDTGLTLFDEAGNTAGSASPQKLRPESPQAEGFGSFPGGMTIGNPRFILVSEPGKAKVRVYALLAAQSPSATSKFRLAYGYTLDNIRVGRIAGSGPAYGINEESLVQFDFGAGGGVKETLPLEGARGLAVALDGSIWVTRGDGLLKLGNTGIAVPSPQNGLGGRRCGAPVVSRSIPGTQNIDRTGYLAFDAGCNEPCTLSLTASLETNITARTAAKFRLAGATKSLNTTRKARYRLRFTNGARRALRNARRRGRKSRVIVTMTAFDRGLTGRQQAVSLILS